MFGQFFDVNYSDSRNFLSGLQLIVQLLKDSELPVRLKAAICLRFVCQSELGSHMPQSSPLLYSSDILILLCKFSL